jgi:hypothetical protein
MKENLIIKLSVERMKEQLQIAYNAHCDEMKETFKQTIEQETSAFLKYGLSKMVQEEARLLVRDELRSQVRDFVRSNRDIIIKEVKEDLAKKAKIEMKDMVYDALASLKGRKSEYEDNSN